MTPKSTQPSCAILIDGLECPHGTEMLAILVAGELVGRGWNVTFHTALYRPARSSWTTLLEEKGIRVYRAGFWFLTRYSLPHRFAAWRFWRVVRKNRPTVIWSPTNDMLTCFALGRRPPDSPPFFVHDPNEATAQCPHYAPLWFQMCHRVNALSVHGRRQLEGALAYYKIQRPVEVVWPASMEPKIIAPLGDVEKRVRFGQFGRIWSMKGSLFSVAAFAQCVAAGGNAELHFFGEGAFRAATEELAASLGVRDRVHFHGSYSWTELDGLAATIDVGLMPSVYEGFGLVLLEMMLRGRPVIASDVGSSREMLEGLGGGWVVPRTNTEALARAMLECCRNPAEVRTKGAQARVVWSEHFTPERMMDRYFAFWRRHGADIPG